MRNISLKREQGSLSNDATQPASKDLSLARISIPFSVESPCAQAFDSKLLANSASPPTTPRKNDVSSHKTLSVFSPQGDGVTPAKTLSRKRFTDNNLSKTSELNDDFQHLDKKLKRAKHEWFFRLV